MDLSSFSVNVKRGNSHRFQYEIDLTYNDRKWSRYRTFSEFEQLQQDLIDSNFCDVPLLPDVNFAAGLAALEDLHNAEDYLNTFLNDLFSRADTRCSRHLLEFVDLIHYLDYIPEPPKAKLVSSSPTFNLSVSDCIVLDKFKLLIVAYEEKTFISKLGKMWSFIELDLLGAIKVFKYNDLKFVEKGCFNFTHKVRCLAFCEETQTLLFGTDSGHVERYYLSLEDPTKLDFIDSLKLHENAILSLTLCDNHYYTSSYDGGIRKVNLGTNRIVSGGKINQRLKGGRIMTATFCNDLMIIGSTNNDLFTYYMGNKVPLFLSSVQVKEPCTVRKIVNQENNLFIAHGNTISCYSYNKMEINLKSHNFTSNCNSGNCGGGREDEKVKVIELSTISTTSSISTSRASVSGVTSDSPTTSVTRDENEEITVKLPTSCRRAKFAPQSTESLLYSSDVYDLVYRQDYKQVIAAHHEIISIWCTETGRMLFAWFAHRDEVHYLHLFREQNLLLSGGSDGQLKLWSLPARGLL